MSESWECIGLFGMIFGHRYEGRYDAKLPDGLKTKYACSRELEAMKDRTYRGDVCRRCGHVVNNQTKENQHGQ